MNEKGEDGVIYILTNPSFEDYIKIGYADNLEKRLAQLNKSECIPFAFRVYAVYHVSNRLRDLPLHDLIDSLNPDLRAIDTFDGKERKREFYAMKPEEAYALLDSIAKISGTEDKLQRMEPEGHEIMDEQLANEIHEEETERRSRFSFEKCGIPVGAEIALWQHPDIIATVKEDNQIEYKGETYSLTALAKKLLDVNYDIHGTMCWTYNGKTLNDIRLELERKGLYK